MKRYERNSGIALITLIITIVILIIISGVVIGSTLGEDKTVDKTLETRIDVTKREITKAIGLFKNLIELILFRHLLKATWFGDPIIHCFGCRTYFQ